MDPNSLFYRFPDLFSLDFDIVGARPSGLRRRVGTRGVSSWRARFSRIICRFRRTLQPRFSSIQASIISRTSRKARSRSSSVPAAAAGSGKFWWTFSPPPGKKGQASPARSRDRHHQVELHSLKFGQALGPLARDVDAPLRHRPDGEGVRLRWEGSGAFDLKTVAVQVAQEPFGILASGPSCWCRRRGRGIWGA